MTHLHHKLSALVDGELSGGSRRRALAHLKSCEDCRRELHATLQLKRRLTGLRDSEPSADLFATLDSLPESFGAGWAAASARGRLHVRRALAGAGTLSVAIVALAYAVGAPEHTAAVAVSPPLEEANAAFAAAGGSGLSDPAVDALLAESGGTSAAWRSGDLAPVAFGLGAAAAATSIRRGDDAVAVRLLRRAMRAPERVAFRGVRTVRDYTPPIGGEIRVAVHHVPDQGTSYRVLSSGGSGPALFIDGDHSAVESAAGDVLLAMLTRRFDVAVLGRDAMAGRPATVVGVGDPDGLVAAFWIDDATGVVLGRDLFDAGTLVRSSHFDRLAVSHGGFMPHPPPALNPPADPNMPIAYAGALGDEGWDCPTELADGLALTALGRLGGSDRVVEAVYSDGISSAAVFEQRGSLDASTLTDYRRVAVGSTPVYVRDGVPSTWIWESDGTVYTLLSDAPPAQAGAVVADLPHDGASDSALDRVGLGMRRIGEFLSPIG